MIIRISIKAFSSNPDLLTFRSYKTYKAYCSLHLSRLGVGGGKELKLQTFTVQKEQSALPVPSSTTANSHDALTAVTMCASKVPTACKLASIKLLRCTLLFQKNSLATYVPIIHQLWPVPSYSVAHLWSKAFSFSLCQNACQGWRKLGNSLWFTSRASKQNQRMWWQERNTHSETTVNKNNGMHKPYSWHAT